MFKEVGFYSVAFLAFTATKVVEQLFSGCSPVPGRSSRNRDTPWPCHHGLHGPCDGGDGFNFLPGRSRGTVQDEQPGRYRCPARQAMHGCRDVPGRPRSRDPALPRFGANTRAQQGTRPPQTRTGGCTGNKTGACRCLSSSMASPVLGKPHEVIEGNRVCRWDCTMVPFFLRRKSSAISDAVKNPPSSASGKCAINRELRVSASLREAIPRLSRSGTV